MKMSGLTERVDAILYGSSDAAGALLAELPEDAASPELLVLSCLRRQRAGRCPGLFLDERFEMPHLRACYPDDVLNFLVPDSYSPNCPTGLLVLLHGGGNGTPRSVARQWLEDVGTDPGTYHFGHYLKNHPCISVAPSNLLLPTHKRWSNPLSDAYILAIIEEASYRYNIDSDRIFLLGQSMGGFGAFHTVQTLGDRFACTGSHAGAWYFALWQGLRNVNFYMMHGVADAVPGTRPRFTDTAFSRLASAVLSGLHIPHVYREHQDGHSFTGPEARRTCLEFIDYIRDVHRDPFPRHVVTASRKGAFQLYDSPHHYWVSIDRVTFGTFELDHVETTESTPSYCTTDFRHRLIRVPGGTVDAVYDGDNHFTVRTHMVNRFTLWLSPTMIDFARPVVVEVNGTVCHDQPARPTLATAVESYLRKRDEGQLYPAKIELDIRVDDWARQKVLFPKT